MILARQIGQEQNLVDECVVRHTERPKSVGVGMIGQEGRRTDSTRLKEEMKYRKEEEEEWRSVYEGRGSAI